ncbi:MAG: thioesterase [Euryarchaeota archaeon]|nr:thioesterase [Euryarchaeota archaeon]|tara:strand:+ start:1188 stop:1682 length:495 start_codon:yes stop_codon:yes gene_type:complete
MPIDEGKLKSEFKSLLGPVKFRLFSLVSMPAARFAGLRMDHLDESSCVTSIPGGWRSQNPFKTMYWAVQGMGAELATGAAPFAMSRAMPEKLRMFVVGTEANFTKRAKGRISFTCEDVSAARKAIELSASTGESVECDMRTIGTDSSGDIVSEWVFKWNFLVMD